MRWSFGLHQFLEMLHATKLSPENLSMCYLSTMTFIRRYKKNVIGLTGTIGGGASRKFLRDVYNVDFVEIPPFMQWRHINLPHIFCENTEEWVQKIVAKVVKQLYKGRACLVITQYIHFAEILSREIRSRTTGLCGTYTGATGDMDISGKLAPGTCIVATNLAGRGTDLKLSDHVKNAGGLHVVLTSLPENERVERQNIGRSSRTGQIGSSQMILNWTHIDDQLLDEMYKRAGDATNHKDMIETLKSVRDEYTLRRVDFAVQEMNEIQRSDDALTEFIKLRSEVVKNFSSYGPDLQKNIRDGLNIRFGMYVAAKNSCLDPEAVKRDFADLRNISTQNMERCFNDYVYPVPTAWHQPWNPKNDWAKFEIAQKLLTRAIEVDSKFAGAAFYVRGYWNLVMYREYEKKDYIWKAIDDFKKSKEVMDRLIEQFKLLIVATKRKGEKKTKIETQMERMIEICGTITANINVLIGIDVGHELEKNRRLLKELQKRNAANADIKEVREVIKTLEENSGLEKGVLQQIADSGAELNIKEHKLKDILPEKTDRVAFADEIDYFEKEGYIGFITVEKREKIKWWSVIAVAVIGILKIVGGALLAVFTGSVLSGIGVGLMIGGVFDIYTAIKDGIIDRSFDWGAFGLEQLFDLITSVLTAGAGKILKAGKGVVAGVRTTTKAVAKEALKTSMKKVAKQVATKSLKIAGRMVISATILDEAKDRMARELNRVVMESLKNQLQHNTDLKDLVDKDNSNKNRAYTNVFVTRGYDDFVKRVSSNLTDELRKSVGEGIRKNIKANGETALSHGIRAQYTVMNWSIVLQRINENLKELPRILREVAENSKAAGSQIYGSRVYDEKGELTVNDVIEDLGMKISKFCVKKSEPETNSVLTSHNFNLVIDKKFERTEKQRQDIFRKIQSAEDVAKRVRETKNNSRQEDGKLLDHVTAVAENSSNTMDRVNAEYLAEVILSPIEIEYTKADGNKALLVYGSKFTENAPIRLIYEMGNYYYPDRTVFGSSLIEMVAQQTLFDYTVLEKAIANHMLNHLPQTRETYMRSASARLITRGIQSYGRIPNWACHNKNIESYQTVEELLRKVKTGPAWKLDQTAVVTTYNGSVKNLGNAAFEWISKKPRYIPLYENPTPQYFFDGNLIYGVTFSQSRSEAEKYLRNIHAYGDNTWSISWQETGEHGESNVVLKDVFKKGGIWSMSQ